MRFILASTALAGVLILLVSALLNPTAQINLFACEGDEDRGCLVETGALFSSYFGLYLGALLIGLASSGMVKATIMRRRRSAAEEE